MCEEKQRIKKDKEVLLANITSHLHTWEFISVLTFPHRTRWHTLAPRIHHFHTYKTHAGNQVPVTHIRINFLPYRSEVNETPKTKQKLFLFVKQKIILWKRLKDEWTQKCWRCLTHLSVGDKSWRWELRTKVGDWNGRQELDTRVDVCDS